MSGGGKDEDANPPGERESALPRSLDRFFDRFGGSWLTGTPRGELPIYKQSSEDIAASNWTPPPARSPRMQRIMDGEGRIVGGCFRWIGRVGLAFCSIATLVGLLDADMAHLAGSLGMAVLFAGSIWIGRSFSGPGERSGARRRDREPGVRGES